MPFIRNIWYVAAWSSEIEANKPLGRIIIGEPVVLWRGADGELIAMEDRCPHRHAPLSMGRIEDDTIQCMYHGLKFSKEGGCLHVPGSDKIPPNSSVQRFPVVEKDDWVWVWFGDAELADETEIPDAFGIANDKFIGLPGDHITYKANYELVNDNLTDLSHVDFVHETTLGKMTGSIWSEDSPEVSKIEGGLRLERWMSKHFNPEKTRGDTWNVYRYMMPGLFLQESYVYPVGTAEKCEFKRPPEDLEPIFARMDQQAVTPISETETQYFFAAGIQKKYADNSPASEGTLKIIQAAFAEDHAMIEAQQRIWNLTDEGTSKAFIPYDKAPSIFRRMVASRLKEEATASN